ncbi:MAG: SRPBCC family protein [Gammaproteobacteria bacterium]
MQVKLEKTIPLQATSSEAWRLLRDVSRVAECVPGARVTEQLDETHYKGEVRVKIGPAAATFQGEFEVRSLDADKHQLQLIGKGKDARGTSTATMDLTASLHDDGAGRSELLGVSTVSVTGKMASLGGRMLNQVAEQILAQFAANFSTRVTAMGEGAAAEKATAAIANDPGELHAFALLWHVFADFLRRLFGRKSGKAG